MSSVRSLRRILISLAAGAALAGSIAGCADVVTYGKDSRARGLQLYEQQQYADAAGAFRNAVRQNPRDYHSYCYLGESYSRLNQFQQAIPAFRTSLEVQPQTYDGAHDLKSKLRSMSGLAGAIAKSDSRDAETSAVEARARGHSTADDYLLLAKIHAARGDADGAIDAYNRAAVLAPDQLYVVKEYGLYLVSVGQNNRAAPPLRRAYSLDNSDEQVNAALRKLGVVPGPSLLPQDQLAQPTLPQGPLPDLTAGSGRD